MSKIYGKTGFRYEELDFIDDVKYSGFPCVCYCFCFLHPDFFFNFYTLLSFKIKACLFLQQ